MSENETATATATANEWNESELPGAGGDGGGDDFDTGECPDDRAIPAGEYTLKVLTFDVIRDGGKPKKVDVVFEVTDEGPYKGYQARETFNPGNKIGITILRGFGTAIGSRKSGDKKFSSAPENYIGKTVKAKFDGKIDDFVGTNRPRRFTPVVDTAAAVRVK